MKYDNVTTEKKERSQVEISADIPAAILSHYRAKAIRDLNNNVTIDGFRKGHIPEKVLIEKVGELAILEECAELAIKDIAPEIIEKNVPTYIGQPKISITKLAPENPLGIKIAIAVRPEVTLPDYKNISKTHASKKEEKVEITEKEIDDVVEEIRKQRAHVEFHKHNKEEGHSHSDEEIDAHKPEITDELVKTLGDFKDVADFRSKIKENASKEKDHRALEKRRGLMLEELVKDSTIDVPQLLIDNELNRMFAQFESDISGLGLKVEDYLKHIKKTPEDLIKDWSADAEKRAKLNLILEEIAKKETITADKTAVEEEVRVLMKQHKDIDPLRATAYTEHVLTMEKVIQFLENQK